MPFEIPTERFDPHGSNRNKLIRSNQTKESILRLFIAGYEDFWGVSGIETDSGFISNGSRHTLEEMQACIDLMGATVVQVLTESAGFIAFASQAYPDEFPERYRASAWDYKIEGGRLVLTGLSKLWQKKEEENAE